MTTEKFIESVNQKRKNDIKHSEFQKSIDNHMRYMREVYDAAINNGFTSDQAFYFTYASFNASINK